MLMQGYMMPIYDKLANIWYADIDGGIGTYSTLGEAWRATREAYGLSWIECTVYGPISNKDKVNIF